MHNHTSQSGFLLVLVLVFGAIFFMMVAAFTGYVVTEHQLQEANYQKVRALEVAESGLDYYRWYLAHYPDDTTNGTGDAGPYVHQYFDPEGDAIGEFSLEIASSTWCNEVYAVDIYSTGYTYDHPEITRTVYGRYARPTVTEYAYIINANVWAGNDRTIIGPYHANGIIRMDGTNNSTVTSGQENWECDDDEMPCDPYADGATVDAVYGDGPNSDLWSFPAPPINFTGLTVDLAAMQGKATSSGVYIPPSGFFGYRLSFQNDGTLDVYRVDEVYSYTASNSQIGEHDEKNVIKDDDPYATYTIPQNCPLVLSKTKCGSRATSVER